MAVKFWGFIFFTSIFLMFAIIFGIESTPPKPEPYTPYKVKTFDRGYEEKEAAQYLWEMEKQGCEFYKVNRQSEIYETFIPVVGGAINSSEKVDWFIFIHKCKKNKENE